MPRVKRQVTPELNVETVVDKLLKGYEDKKYIIVNYEWFYDYHKLLNMVSKEFTLRLIPDREGIPIIELSASHTVSVVVRIPILSTNIDEDFLTKIKYITPYSKFNNNFLLFVFDDHKISYRHMYKANVNIIEPGNDTYVSKREMAFEDEESPEYEPEEDDEIVGDSRSDNNEPLSPASSSSSGYEFLSIVDESIDVVSENCYNRIDEELIRSVVAYVPINFENLRDIFNRFDNTEVRVELFRDNLELRSKTFTHGKNRVVNLKIQPVHNFNKRLVFFISSKAITQFKTLSTSFKIVPHEDKKIFKQVELKIVYRETIEGRRCGITMFPSNFKDRDSKTSNGFNIYNSAMVFVPEIEKNQ